MISYLLLHFWKDQYSTSQARVTTLEYQLVGLQVVDDDDEDEASDGEDEGHTNDDNGSDDDDNARDPTADPTGKEDDHRGDEEWLDLVDAC